MLKTVEKCHICGEDVKGKNNHESERNYDIHIGEKHDLINSQYATWKLNKLNMKPPNMTFEGTYNLNQDELKEINHGLFIDEVNKVLYLKNSDGTFTKNINH